MSSDKVVPPGGEGSIKVTFKTGHYQGQRSKTVSVTTNDPENPKLTLTVNANIVVDFALQPPHLYMGRFSKNDTTVRTTKVIAKEPAKLKITKVTPSNDLLSAKIVESKPQAPAPDDPNKKIEKVEPPKDDSGLELEVTLKPGMKVGRFNEKITLETNIEKVPTYELNVSGEVLGDIQIEPRLVSLRGEGQEKEFSSSVKIFTDNQDVKFKVTKAACEDPKFETTIETVEKDRSYKINVVYKGEPPEKYVRSKLLVSTDSPEQPEIELPVYLSVKPPEDASVKQPDVPPSTANTLEKAIQQTAPKEQPKDKPKDPPKDK